MRLHDSKGITIVIAVFLFMILSILALSLAQMITVDTKAITEPAGGGVTRHRMGPMKETQRFQILFLAQAGLNHLRKLLVDDPDLTLTPGFTPNATSPIRNNDGNTVALSTGFYRIYFENVPIDDPDHTILGDARMVSEARIPPHTGAAEPGGISTTLDLRERFWRAARAYGENLINQTGSFAVNAIDTSDTTATEGLDRDMGQRNAVGEPPSPTLDMILENPWEITSCSAVSGTFPQCRFIVDFGMDVTFDEIRFLNNSNTNYITAMTLQSWDDATRSWVNRGSASFSQPGVGGSAPYYRTVTPCPSPNVYNGDRCTDFLDVDGNDIHWGTFVGGNECVAVNTCSENLPLSARSYIGRMKFGSSFSTRRIRLTFDGVAPGGEALRVPELGVYCCGSYSGYPPPAATIRPVLKVTHGVARIGLTHNASNQIVYPIGATYPSSAQTDGALTKSSTPYE